MEAEADRARVEAKYARTDKGAAMLNAARLKLELEASREKLAQLESQARACCLCLQGCSVLYHM